MGALYGRPLFSNVWGGSRTHLSLGNHSEAQLCVDQGGRGLREVALVRQEAASPEAARTAQLAGEGGGRININMVWERGVWDDKQKWNVLGEFVMFF